MKPSHILSLCLLLSALPLPAHAVDRTAQWDNRRASPRCERTFYPRIGLTREGHEEPTLSLSTEAATQPSFHAIDALNIDGSYVRVAEGTLEQNILREQELFEDQRPLVRTLLDLAYIPLHEDRSRLPFYVTNTVAGNLISAHRARLAGQILVAPAATEHAVGAIHLKLSDGSEVVRFFSNNNDEAITKDTVLFAMEAVLGDIGNLHVDRIDLILTRPRARPFLTEADAASLQELRTRNFNNVDTETQIHLLGVSEFGQPDTAPLGAHARVNPDDRVIFVSHAYSAIP